MPESKLSKESIDVKERRQYDNEEIDNSLCRKWSVPCCILVVASLICLSQLQLAFETRYEYHYKVKDIHEDGDGETYSYNMWKGVQSVRVTYYALYFFLRPLSLFDPYCLCHTCIDSCTMMVLLCWLLLFLSGVEYSPT